MNDTTYPNALATSMTIRECFAATAMQGILADHEADFPALRIAELSVAMADALIEALNKKDAA